MSQPRVVLGMPAFARPDALAQTLESLLSQTYADFALVIVDDAPSAESRAVVQRYAARDARVRCEENESRLGMVGNWRKAFERGRALYPASAYFAWVSDHDVWHPRWLEVLVEALDRDDDVVLVYPRSLRILDGDAKLVGESFHTAGVRSAAARLRRAARYMLAGDMIYGLMRARALEAAGVFRGVITPDRQVLLSLSLFGEFRQLPDVLWCREYVRTFDLKRQRDVFFPSGAPAYLYLPSHLQHFAVMLWDFAVRGRGRPVFGRVAGIRYATMQLWWSTARQLAQPKAGWRSIFRHALPAHR